MKICYSEKFLNLLEDNDSYILLLYYKVGTITGNYSTPENIVSNYLEILNLDSEFSPTSGYYKLYGVYNLEKSILQLLLNFLNTNLGIIKLHFRIIYVYYLDLLKNNIDLAFILYNNSYDYLITDDLSNILKGDLVYDSVDNIYKKYIETNGETKEKIFEETENPYSRIHLIPDSNIITINNFSYLGRIDLLEDDDTEFLEGVGDDTGTGMYLGSDTSYVTLDGYESYVDEQSSYDTKDYLWTTWINKFGLKIY